MLCIDFQAGVLSTAQVSNEERTDYFRERIIASHFWECFHSNLREK
jgi:hypothetical protein